MQNVQARDSFFSILMMFWRRENYLTATLSWYSTEMGPGLGLPPGGPLGTVALWQAAWRKQVRGRYSSPVPFGPYQAAAGLPHEVKRKWREPSLSACWSITSLGHSQSTGRWHRVTAANLEKSFFFFFSPCSWVSTPHSIENKPTGAATRTPLRAWRGRYDIWLVWPRLKEAICWHLHFPKGFGTPQTCPS